MATKNITISIAKGNPGKAVAPTSNLTYSDASVHALPQDQISWSCGDGTLAIHFGDATPFDQKTLQGGKKPKITAQIRSDAAVGRYKYIAVVVPSDGKIVIDDPEIIVDADDNIGVRP